MDFNKIVQKKDTPKKKQDRNKPKKVYKEIEVKKVGRPSWKDEDVDYSRISFDFPTEKLDKLKMFKLAMGYKDQDEMINAIIFEYFETHKDEFEDYLKEKLANLKS